MVTQERTHWTHEQLVTFALDATQRELMHCWDASLLAERWYHPLLMMATAY